MSLPVTPPRASSPSQSTSTPTPFPPSSTSHNDTTTPQTPTTPTTSFRTLNSDRRSTTSIRRKPVPQDSEDGPFELSTMTPTQPPRYVLPVEPLGSPLPPSYIEPASTSNLNLTPEMDVYGTGPSMESMAMDELPRYAEESATEPKTLARGLWLWGWACPLLWAIGMCM
jgi:hypothetical protein